MKLQMMQLGSVLGALAFCACGGGTAPPVDAGSDTVVSQPDVATAADTGGTDAGGGVPVINGCDNFTDMSTGSASDRMIMLNTSHQFDMPCMTIAAGQSVMFMWNLATYPIVPGVAPSHSSDPAGSASTPIQMHSSGSVYTVTFPTAGLYPFYVMGQDANGMLGVIQVQ